MKEETESKRTFTRTIHFKEERINHYIEFLKENGYEIYKVTKM